MGLETNNAAADYIALYHGDKKTLAESLSAIQSTAAKILDELLNQERPVSQSQKQEMAHNAERPASIPPVPTSSPDQPSMDR